jgi:N,N'-diacetyllegionaminate synthase
MEHVIVIAEAGVNHNGDIKLAKKLIELAAEAKADYVKFQTFKAENLVTSNAPKALYQSENMKEENNSQFNMLKKLELGYQQHFELVKHCKKNNIKFLSTPFEAESIDFLDTLNLDFYKIPSGEITNLPFLKKIGSKKKKVILSTGLANIGEIEDALNILASEGVSLSDIYVLHCNTEYPTPYKDVNLKAMLTIKETFKVKIGYSDHTMGIEIPIAAVALGAKVIEKHFTLSREMDGPDHRASIEPNELKQMVNSIRNIELALSGDGLKRPTESEVKNLSVIRKSIYLAESLSKGTVLTENNLIMKRPAAGLSPMHINFFLNKKLKKDLIKEHLLQLEDIE